MKKFGILLLTATLLFVTVAPAAAHHGGRGFHGHGFVGPLLLAPLLLPFAVAATITAGVAAAVTAPFTYPYTPYPPAPAYAPPVYAAPPPPHRPRTGIIVQARAATTRTSAHAPADGHAPVG